MNKRDYLDLLRYYLKDLPSVVVDDIIYDYEEHFNAGIENGKTEYQISEELGSPDDIAKEYLGSEVYKKRRKYVEDFSVEDVEKSDTGWIKWALIALVVLFFPLILGIVGGAFGLFMGIMGGLFGGGLGSIGGAIGLFFSIFTGTSVGTIALNPITKLFASIFLLALGLFLIGLGIKFVKFIVKLIRDIYVSIRWKWGV